MVKKLSFFPLLPQKNFSAKTPKKHFNFTPKKQKAHGKLKE